MAICEIAIRTVRYCLWYLILLIINTNILIVDLFKPKVSISRRDCITFLKKHSEIRKVLNKNLPYIPIVILEIILNYAVIKADPQKILERPIYYKPLINYCNIKHLQQFINEGWNINKLGKYIDPSWYIIESRLRETSSIRQDYQQVFFGQPLIRYNRVFVRRHYKEKRQMYFGTNTIETTPLIMACNHLDYKLIKFYLDNGANVYVKNKIGKDALTVLLYHREVWITRIIAQQCINLLKNYSNV